MLRTTWQPENSSVAYDSGWRQRHHHRGPGLLRGKPKVLPWEPDTASNLSVEAWMSLARDLPQIALWIRKQATFRVGTYVEDDTPPPHASQGPRMPPMHPFSEPVAHFFPHSFIFLHFSDLREFYNN